jgi:hypothetical protein
MKSWHGEDSFDKGEETMMARERQGRKKEMEVRPYFGQNFHPVET